MAQSEVFEDEILSRPENTDNPTDEMPEQRDHGKNITRTSSIRAFGQLVDSTVAECFDDGQGWWRHRGLSPSCGWIL
jgi:hypothetical protein